MTMLNKSASHICHSYEIHACTDVTGFGFLGHLNEMINKNVSAEIDSISIPVIKGALHYAEEFLFTAAAQRNRNHVAQLLEAGNTDEMYVDLLSDPQTSGGLLLAVAPQDAEALEAELQAAGLPAAIVGEILEKEEKQSEITVIF